MVPVGEIKQGNVRWLFGAFAAFSLFYAFFTTQQSHSLWAACAVVTYILAAFLSGAGRSRTSVFMVALIGAVAVPMCFLVGAGIGQPEVQVVKESAARLVEQGTPYLSDPSTVYDYNPYGPAMALFGLPGVLLGDVPIADPRIWYVVFLAFCLWASWRLLGRPSSSKVHVLAWAAFSPLVALSVVTSGVDVPLVGVLALGAAAALERRSVLCGCIIGCALLMKWTALPAFALAFLVLARRGRPVDALQMTGVVVAVVGIGIGTTAGPAPQAFIEHTVLFPMGQGELQTPAGRSMLGGILGNTIGAWLPFTFLIAAAAVLAWRLLTVPLTVYSVGVIMALGYTVLFLLAPSARAGYFMVPLLIYALAAMYRNRPRDEDPPSRTRPTRTVAAHTWVPAESSSTRGGRVQW